MKLGIYQPTFISFLLVLLLPYQILMHFHLARDAKFDEFKKTEMKVLTSAILPQLRLSFFFNELNSYALHLDNIHLDSSVGSHLLLPESQCKKIGLTNYKGRTVKRKGVNSGQQFQLYEDALIRLNEIDEPGKTMEAKLSVGCVPQEEIKMGLSALTRLFEFFVSGKEVYCSIIASSSTHLKHTKMTISL